MSNLTKFSGCEPTDPQICLNYRTQRWTRPKLKGSKIFIFKDLAKAKKFARVESGIIYKCYATNAALTYHVAEPNNNAIKSFWRQEISSNWYAPPGTYLADKVFLLKKVS
jgi:hypothetical protein